MIDRIDYSSTPVAVALLARILAPNRPFNIEVAIENELDEISA